MLEIGFDNSGWDTVKRLDLTIVGGIQSNSVLTITVLRDKIVRFFLFPMGYFTRKPSTKHCHGYNEKI